ncbi:MAG: hypothetical protein K5924_02360 [Chloroflexi bacterium]|nr:hypothetical protein [Chloroflexota bacterium]
MFRRPDIEPRGQVMVIVAVAFTVLILFLALLFDGAHGMSTRRQMQDAGDAAALAAANVLQVGTPRGCSATSGGTAPRATVAQAARNSLATNLSWFDASTAVITCPAGYDNQAVAVELATTSARFFGGVMGGDINVATRSAAVNGQITGTLYSIVLLDPHNPSWPNGRRGCPSMLLSGGPTVTLEGSVQVNSACPAGSGGALSTNGNASNLTMTNGSRIRLVGGYSPGALTISPAPITGVDPIADPLSGLPPMDTSGMTVRSTSRLVLNNQTMALDPGIYTGGIQLRNSSIALLRPGIYVMNGGGLDIGAQASVMSVADGVSVPPPTWSTACAVGSCGVLIYNTGTTSTMGQITVGAGATLRLRAYDPTAQAGGVTDYRNLLIWQAGSPVQTSSYAQPEVALNGGGTVDIRGTVYAPSAKVSMGGGAGGGGGSATNLTLQFISWNLEFRGNSSFTFYFRDADFARPTHYGLVR